MKTFEGKSYADIVYNSHFTQAFKILQQTGLKPDITDTTFTSLLQTARSHKFYLARYANLVCLFHHIKFHNANHHNYYLMSSQDKLNEDSQIKSSAPILTKINAGYK